MRSYKCCSCGNIEWIQRDEPAYTTCPECDGTNHQIGCTVLNDTYFPVVPEGFRWDSDCLYNCECSGKLTQGKDFNKEKKCEDCNTFYFYNNNPAASRTKELKNLANEYIKETTKGTKPNQGEIMPKDTKKNPAAKKVAKKASSNKAVPNKVAKKTAAKKAPVKKAPVKKAAVKKVDPAVKKVDPAEKKMAVKKVNELDQMKAAVTEINAVIDFDPPIKIGSIVEMKDQLKKEMNEILDDDPLSKETWNVLKKLGYKSTEAAKPVDSRKAHAATTSKKANKSPKTTGKKGEGIIATIIGILQKGKPITRERIHAQLVTKFPDRNADSMKTTVTTQVPTRIRRERKLDVQGDRESGYFIK